MSRLSDLCKASEGINEGICEGINEGINDKQTI
jgi:hypothetical protein